MGEVGVGLQALSPDASDPNLALGLSLGPRIPSVSGGTQIRFAGAARSISDKSAQSRCPGDCDAKAWQQVAVWGEGGVWELPTEQRY